MRRPPIAALAGALLLFACGGQPLEQAPTDQTPATPKAARQLTLTYFNIDG